MKNILKDRRMKHLFFAFVLLAIVGLAMLIFNRRGRKRKVEMRGNQAEKEQLIPTLAAGEIEVNLRPEIAGKEVALSIDKVPPGTATFDYELSYKTKDKGLQGVIGTVTGDEFANGRYHKKITLGTCSSGKCVYHQVVGQINLTLRFYGDYGERLFEEKYQL